MKKWTAIALLLCLWSMYTAAAPSSWLNVVDYGARADGETDDTAAFQEAMEECSKNGGGVVYVPAGHYMIGSHLDVPRDVTLRGNWHAPPTVDAYHDPDADGDDANRPPLLNGSVLLAVENAGKPDARPFIALGWNATLWGITVFYPRQTRAESPIEYPWCIGTSLSGADNCSIVNCLLVNPYKGVDFGSRASGRHYIRNLYGQPLYRGLHIGSCLDVGRVENVHFWPFWTAADGDSGAAEFQRNNGTAFLIGRTDWEQMYGCFCISYNVGFHFRDNEPPAGPMRGPGNAMITGGGADHCRTAVLVESGQSHAGHSFVNSQFYGDIVVAPTNNSPIRFTGCGFFGSYHGLEGTALAKIAGTGRVSFSNCHFYCFDPSNEGRAVIQADGGRICIDGCAFLNSQVVEAVNCNPIPLVLEPDVISAVITGNEFYGELRVIDRARGRVVIDNNVDRTDEDRYPQEEESNN